MTNKNSIILSIILLILGIFVLPTNAQEFKRYSNTGKHRVTTSVKVPVAKGGGSKYVKPGYRLRGSKNYGRRTIKRSDTIQLRGRGR